MTQDDRTDAAAGLASFPLTTAFDFPEYQVQRTLGSCFGLVVRSMGANAIVGMRFDSSEIGHALTEIAAYGTAVVIGPRPPA